MKNWWKMIILAAVFLAAAASLRLATQNIRPERELALYLQFLRDRGEKLEINAVIPPPVPAESNGVAQVLGAFAALTPTGWEWTNLPIAMQMIAPGKAMVAWAQPVVVSVKASNSWAETRMLIEANRPALDQLQQAMTFPALDFGIDYHDADATLPQYQPLKLSVELLAATAVTELQASNAPAAATHLHTLLALVWRERGERWPGMQHLRLMMASNALTATWEFLQSPQITESQLASLQSDWERITWLEEFEKAYQLLRAVTVERMRDFRASPAKIGLHAGRPAGGGEWWEDARDYAIGSAEAVLYREQIFMWQSSWSYADEMPILRTLDAVINGLRAARTNPALGAINQSLAPQFAALQIEFPEHSSFIQRVLQYRMWSWPGILKNTTNTCDQILAAETARVVVLTAIALKRFQLQQGQFPETLAELKPAFLAAVPLDPVDGQPLRYRRNVDGTFQLYSVGADGKDDGGNPTVSTGTWNHSSYWQDATARDWVWPQPATPAEVQYFYDHSPY